MNERQLSRHIGELYELVERPESLPDLLGSLSDTLGSMNTNLCTIENGQFNFVSQVVPEEFLEDVYLPVLAEDPWFVEVQWRQPPLVCRGSDLVPDRIYRKSMVYGINHYLGFEHMVGMQGISPSLDFQYFISSARWPGQPDFDNAHVDLMRHLLPHLGRAFRLRENNFLSPSSFSAPVFEFEGGELVNANTAGQMFLDRHEPRHGLAPASKKGQSLRDSLIRAGRSSEEPALVKTEQFSGVTLPQTYLDRAFVRRHRTLLVISSETERTNDALLSLLSPAERSVVELLGRGLSIKDIATLKARSPLTIRTQVKSAMRKANVRSQAQLLLLLFKQSPYHSGH